MVMGEMVGALDLVGAISREQIGVKYDICFPKTRVFGIPFDKSIEQGGEGESVLVHPDDEERLQGIARRTEGAADGCQDQE